MYFGVITHYFVYGSCQALFDYLNIIKEKSVMIEIPLSLNKDFDKICITNENGKENFNVLFTKINSLNYVFQFFYSFYFQLKLFEKCNVIISCNPLNCFPTLLIKKIFRKKYKVIYFSIDYSSNRFSNKLINLIYQFFDKYCYKNSSYNWDISPTMISKKINRYKSKKEVSQIKNKTMIVPVGIWSPYNENKKKMINKNKIRFIYIGHFLKRNGIYDIIDCLTSIEKKINFEMVYIGGGDETPNLVKKISDSNLKNKVKIISWVEKSDIYKYIHNSDFSFALYQKCEETYFCNPTKIIDYISCGTPVITTKNNFMGNIVEESKSGIILENHDEFLKKIIFLSNKNTYNLYSENSYKLSNKYKWNTIFKNALSRIN